MTEAEKIFEIVTIAMREQRRRVAHFSDITDGEIRQLADEASSNEDLLAIKGLALVDGITAFVERFDADYQANKPVGVTFV